VLGHSDLVAAEGQAHSPAAFSRNQLSYCSSLDRIVPMTEVRKFV
jgi:hypothetical protein